VRAGGNPRGQGPQDSRLKKGAAVHEDSRVGGDSDVLPEREPADPAAAPGSPAGAGGRGGEPAHGERDGAGGGELF